MKKSLLIYIIFIFISFLFSGCLNKHGVSLKYYSDCKEYYDLQGYYHKECGEDDLRTYTEIREDIDKGVDYIQSFYKEKKETKPTPNVW